MIALADLIATHLGAFEYDWRTRFALTPDDIGCLMTWGEAVRQTGQLSHDPSSHVAAAISGWSHPTTHEAIVLMDRYDFEHQVVWLKGGKKGPKPKPYPRPWRVAGSKERLGIKPRLTQDEIAAALRAAGHTAPMPT